MIDHDIFHKQCFNIFFQKYIITKKAKYDFFIYLEKLIFYGYWKSGIMFLIYFIYVKLGALF